MVDVFVYGTLWKGEANHDLVKGAAWLPVSRNSAG